MAIQIQLRRGTTYENDLFKGQPGEITMDTEKKNFRIHDNVRTGGYVIPADTDVVHKTNNQAETIAGIKTFSSQIVAQNNGISLTNASFTKGTTPSNTVYWGIRANDKTNDSTWSATRVGTLEWAIQNNNTVTGTFNAIKNEANSTASSSISVVYDTTNNKAWATAPKPDNDSSTSYNRIVTTNWANQANNGTTYYNNLVHITGTETISGSKTFTSAINGTATRAEWADLAENYQSDEKYAVGTLIRFGGEKDITIAHFGENCNGVISEKPGYLLDSKLEDGLPVALAGKTPVRVIGKVNKFDRLVLSSVSGVATVKTSDDEKVIAIALENSDIEEEKLVKCVTKFNLD